jgi:hypothetical protein
MVNSYNPLQQQLHLGLQQQQQQDYFQQLIRESLQSIFAIYHNIVLLLTYL